MSKLEVKYIKFQYKKKKNKRIKKSIYFSLINKSGFITILLHILNNWCLKKSNNNNLITKFTLVISYTLLLSLLYNFILVLFSLFFALILVSF